MDEARPERGRNRRPTRGVVAFPTLTTDHYARGLRNSVGLAWHPVTGELWATDNGGDGLGEDVPPEELNILRAGNDYERRRL